MERGQFQKGSRYDEAKKVGRLAMSGLPLPCQLYLVESYGRRTDKRYAIGSGLHICVTSLALDANQSHLPGFVTV